MSFSKKNEHIIQKNRIFLFTIYILSNFFPLTFQLKSTAAEIIHINTKEEPPYQILKNNQITGQTVETVKCIFKSLNLNIEIKVLPWVRAQLEVKNGLADAFFVAVISPERNQYAFPTKDIFNYNWIWILNKDSKLDPNSEDFRKNNSVGVQFGNASLDYLNAKKYNISGIPKERVQGVEMLSANRFDAFLMPDISLEETLKEAKKSKNEFRIVIHSRKKLVLYFGKKYIKKNPTIINLFNSKITSCRKEVSKTYKQNTE